MERQGTRRPAARNHTLYVYAVPGREFATLEPGRLERTAMEDNDANGNGTGRGRREAYDLLRMNLCQLKKLQQRADWFLMEQDEAGSIRALIVDRIENFHFQGRTH